MTLDNFRTIELIWDRANKSIIKTIKTASSDKTGRYLSVKILDDGQEVTLNNATLQLYWEHPNFNTNGIDNFNVVNNTGLFTLTFSEKMLTNIGELNAYLVLNLDDGKITSDSFIIEVFKGANDGVVVPSNGYSLAIRALQDATDKLALIEDGASVAIIENGSITSSKIADNAVSFSKIDFEGGQYSYQDLIWESGTILQSTGLDQFNITRVRTDNFLKVNDGDVITIDPNYDFNYFKYEEENEESYLGTPNAWVKTATFDGDYYIKLSARKSDNSDISSQVHTIPSYFTFDIAPLKIPGDAVADNSISLLKLKADEIPDDYSKLNWELGSVSPVTGADDSNGASTGIRARTSNYLKVNDGDVITIDPNYDFNYFKYTESTGGTYLGTPNAWMKTATITESCYIRFQIKKSNNTDISGQLQTITSLFTFDLKTPKIAGSLVEDGSIELSKLSSNAIDSLISGNVDDNVVDLIMFMGQSNMAGRGTTSTEWPQTAPIVNTGTGYEFRAISDPTKLHPISEPFGVNENNTTSGITEANKTGSMVSAFTNEYFKHTNVPIVGVSASKGGTQISWWQPDGLPLQDAIDRFNSAKTWLESNGYSIRNKYMLWCQGESDGDQSTTLEEYKTGFLNMTNAMFEAGIDKCFIVRIGNHRDNATLYDPIIQAQTELARGTENIILASTKFDKMATLGLMKDQFHYYQYGYNIVGTEAAQNVAFYANTGKEPTLYDWENQELYYSFK